MTAHIIAAVTKRSADLMADAKAAEPKLSQLISDIEHVDGAMRTYDPTYRPHKVKLSRARRVGISRITLNTLRQAKAPMNVRDITLRVMAAGGENQADAGLSKP